MRTPLLEMTCGFLIQLVFCKKKPMWFIGVEVEQETIAPPPKKNPGSAPGYSADGLSHDRLTIDRLSTDCRTTIDRLSTEYRPLYRPSVDRLSTAISTDRSVDTTYSKQDPFIFVCGAG